jgi:hypothetical protein
MNRASGTCGESGLYVGFPPTLAIFLAHLGEHDSVIVVVRAEFEAVALC